MNYDVDLGPLLMADWYHTDAFTLYPIEILTPEAPLPDTNVVMNGKGVFDCDPANDTRCTGERDRYEVTFDKGKTYKLGLVNTGALLTYKFWIDGHSFTVVQTDFVPIKPYVTDTLNVGIGQRYEIIVEANATFEHGSNFWIHANYCDDDHMESRVGIIRYDANDKTDPYSPRESAQRFGFGCQDPVPANLVPVVPRQVGNRANSFDEVDYLKIGLQGYPNISDPNSRIKTWVLANNTMNIDWREPSVEKLIGLSDNPNFDPEYSPITLDFETGEWVYFVIVNNYTLSTANNLRTDPPSVHPIHLHGHDFVILAQGEGPFHKDIVPNLDNPTRRDVADCPIGGYVWIAFKIENPGAWLMHCHIAWHVSAGLSLQYLEQPSRIRPLMEQAGVVDEFADRCQQWTEFYNNTNMVQGVLQEDSGL
ncbi:MAG: hypothetical protein Q9190_000441 [Brigantiaea leucoxantha]